MELKADINIFTDSQYHLQDPEYI